TTTADLNAGTVTNTVTVSGHDDEDTPTSASDMATVIVTNVTPSITVDKTGPTTIAEGSTVTYNFTITNTSTASTDPVTITSVITAHRGNRTAAANAAWIAQGNSGPIVLPPDESFTFSASTTAITAGTVVNTVSVVGHDDENTPATASDSHTLI